MAALMIMIFAMPTSEMKVQAEEMISTEAVEGADKCICYNCGL